MLVLSRKKDESIMIGDEIEIQIMEIEDGKVKIGIKAPRSVSIHRAEVFDRIQLENKASIDSVKSFEAFSKKIKNTAKATTENDDK